MRRQAGWRGWALLVGMLVIGLGAFYGFAIRWRDYGTGDWLAYWSYSRALLLGHGYSNIEWLRPLQQSVGYDRLMMGDHYQPIWNLHNPPPLLALLLPFGAMTFTWATLAWLALNALLYGWAALAYNARLDRPLPPWLALATAALLLPLPQALFWGQITPLAIACLLFAWLAQRRGHDAAVGVLILPLLVKPHLLTVAMALLAWVALRRKAWGSATALGVSLVLMIIAVTVLDPHWVGTWLGNNQPEEWQSVSLPHLLRVAFNLPILFQFAGVVIATAWIVWRHRYSTTIGASHVATATLLSVLVTPFMWHHDAVVMMPALLWGAAKLDSTRYGRVLLLALMAITQAFMPYNVSTPFILPYLFGAILLVGWAMRSIRPPDREGAMT